MAASTVQRGTITCNAAISACGKAGEWQLAMGLFEWRSALGFLVRWLRAQCIVGPSLATPRSAFCGEAGDLQLALSLFAEMAESTVQENAISGDAAIGACGRGLRMATGTEPLGWDDGEHSAAEHHQLQRH